MSFCNNELINIYEELERGINFIDNSDQAAKYTTSTNYSLESETPFQRWYRYKEGFSYSLIKKLIEMQSKNTEGKILDPFLGSGTTCLVADSLFRKCVGFEINPFSSFVSKCKLSYYSDDDKDELKRCINLMRNIRIYDYGISNDPKLSFAKKVFDEDVRNIFLRIKTIISSITKDEKVFNLCKLAWLSILEDVSNYRKAGNGLKIKKTKKNSIKAEEIVSSYVNKLEIIYSDINKFSINGLSQVINDSCLNIDLNEYGNYFDGIIFSPPYANCFDYMEIYKLELWYGDFVKDYTELKQLRKQSFSSNLNSINGRIYDDELFINLLNNMDDDLLWDKKIKLMLNDYFADFDELLGKLNKVLNSGGFIDVVVGNSAYGGIVFPTDLFIAKIAKKYGFIVENIIIDRYLITSSQQYKKTLPFRKYLRESIVCLRKQ